jgi:hypothetical protein
MPALEDIDILEALAKVDATSGELVLLKRCRNTRANVFPLLPQMFKRKSRCSRKLLRIYSGDVRWVDLNGAWCGQFPSPAS